MFFSFKIKSIRKTDRVLEIGPGGSAHPRANVLLEKIYNSSDEAKAQRGYLPPLQTDKQIVYYAGGAFPFKNKEFDYVICSHVLEHVVNPDHFIKEINRVARKGYIEYPLIYYDFLYDIPEHITFLKYQKGKIYWQSKKDIIQENIKPIQLFFNKSLEAGYHDLVNDLKEYLIEGFEWFDHIEIVQTHHLEDLLYKDILLPQKQQQKLIFGMDENISPYDSQKTQSTYTVNLEQREKWLGHILKHLPSGWRILDAGAGERQYKKFCQHLHYVAQDACKYDGQGNEEGWQTDQWETGRIDIKSDIIRIPVDNESFDAVMCIEVFEHIPEPIKALEEFYRILKDDGILILTAPFWSLSHLAPYHFYSGFNQYFFEYALHQQGFDIILLEANGNYFDVIGQELRRVEAVAEEYAQRKLSYFDKKALRRLSQTLKELAQNDQKSHQLTCFGFHILARKKTNKSIPGKNDDKTEKYSAEEKFWIEEINNYIKWYHGEIKELYETPAPESHQKEKRFNESHNAILTWFRGHQQVKYQIDLDLPVDAFKGMKVLDIGAGPIPSAEVFENCHLYCLDPLSLQYFKAGFPYHYYRPTTKFINAPAEQMPFPDHYFDAVISANAIDHVDDIQKTAEEIKRVLKPAGRLRIHAHYHKKKETEPVELNDQIMEKLFKWCSNFKKIQFSNSKTGCVAPKGEMYALWSNF
ncbi:MAG: methyltransferase domain-containing protein [Candidatus Omnitrophica bacterium]|nr:methyltransferase domain-containing protein [Candidatus Omnitrophota bacterium]